MERNEQRGSGQRNKGRIYTSRAGEGARRRMTCPHPSPSCSVDKKGLKITIMLIIFI